MAFCEQCGNKLGENAKFCGKCGTPVSAGQTEAPPTGGMSAPTACAQCGAPLEEGEVFCANCGAKAGAAAQYRPVQAQRQAAGGQVLKKEILQAGSYNGLKFTGIKLLLYGDRLEVKGSKGIYFIVPLAKISSARRNILNNPEVIGDDKYEFFMPKTEVDSWVSAINSVRYEK